jgi:hypothetical protein
MRIAGVLAGVIATIGALGEPVATGRIYGRATTSFGVPLDGVEVRLAKDDSGGPPRMTQTDESGAYYFDHVPEGNYELDAHLLGFSVKKQSVTLRSYLDEGNVVSDFCLEPIRLADRIPLVIHGVVRGKGHGPIPNARIVVLAALDPSMFQDARTDEHGSFRVRTPIRGEGIVYAHYPGYHVEAHCLLLRAGQEEVDFLLRPSDVAAR